VPHAALAPQVHPPPLQPSACVVEQVPQLAPPEPHSDVDSMVTHAVPLQQPLGQEFASHTHALFAHSWPTPQDGPVPHWHRPEAEHVSAVVMSHSVHAVPPVPHATSDPWLQVGPEQQPVAQVSTQPEQRPSPVQVCPEGHELHAPPPLPQAAARFPGSHDSPLQQPVGQPTPSQTHAPPRQCWPDAHAAPLPHVQVPVASQLSARIVLQALQSFPPTPHAVNVGDSQVPSAPQQPFGQDEALHRHTPLMQTCPTPHGELVPHAHSPFGHESAVPAAQTSHVAPLGPHVEMESDLHVVPSQQPSGHDVASHTQRPPTQS
jgi:hypothetical protein